MNKIFSAILKYRWVVIALTIIALALSAFSASQTKINSDVSSYLPESSTSKQTINFLRDNFDIKGDASVCIEAALSDYDDVKKLAGEISELSDIKTVLWLGSYEQLIKLSDTEINSSNPLISSTAVSDLTAPYFTEKDGKTYYIMTLALNVPNSGNAASGVMDQVINLTKAYAEQKGTDYYVGGNAMQSKNMLDSALGDLPKFLIIAVVIIAIILLLTSKSIMASIIFLATIGISILFNMGTNFFTDEISTITFSVAAILQLALSMDYSIFLTHAYEREIKISDHNTAMITALRKTTAVIIASALTTVAGFCALFAMKFEIGFDLGFCLAKGVILSFLTVIIIQPCLMTILKKACDKTTHKTLNPSFEKLSKIPAKFKHWALVLAVVLAVPAVLLSISLKYYYLESGYEDNAKGAQQVAQEIGSQTIFVTEKTTDENQLKLLEKVKTDFPAIYSVNGFYNTIATITKDFSLPIYSSMTDLSEANILTRIPITTSEVLSYLDTGTFPEELNQSVLENVEAAITQKAPAIIKEEITKQSIAEGRQLDTIEQASISRTVIEKMKTEYTALVTAQMDMYKAQLPALLSSFSTIKDSFFTEVDGKEYTYFAVSISGEPESEQSISTVEGIKTAIKDNLNSDFILAAGNAQVVDDLEQITQTDFIIVSVLSAVLILIILILTFKGILLPILLVLLIELAILINLGITSLMGQSINFMSYIIISAIQMGATIDYAILLSKNYRMGMSEAKDKAKAVAFAIKNSAFSIIISMAILICACLSVYFVSSDMIIKEITLLIARGSLISGITVLFILPAILCIGKNKEKVK